MCGCEHFIASLCSFKREFAEATYASFHVNMKNHHGFEKCNAR